MFSHAVATPVPEDREDMAGACALLFARIPADLLLSRREPRPDQDAVGRSLVRGLQLDALMCFPQPVGAQDHPLEVPLVRRPPLLPVGGLLELLTEDGAKGDLDFEPDRLIVLGQFFR